MRPFALILVIVSLVWAATALAHDSLAPRGSEHVWLPSQGWVAGHWTPFEEQALKRALGMDGRDLEAYLYDDHHTLSALARRRGVDPGAHGRGWPRTQKQRRRDERRVERVRRSLRPSCWRPPPAWRS